MYSLSVILRMSLLFTMIALTPVSVMAQRKPEPPRMPTDNQTRRSSITPDFLAAYERAGSPRLFIYTRLVTAADYAAEALNEIGIAGAFGSRLRSEFQHAAIELISPREFELGNRDLVEGFTKLGARDHRGAAAMLGRKVKADFVCFVNITEAGDQYDGTLYRCNYILLDVNRNRILGEYSWDMKPEINQYQLSIKRIGNYSKSVARRIREDIQLSFNSGTTATARTYHLTIHTVTQNQIKSLETAIRSIPSVQNVSRLRYNNGMVTMDVRYPGEPIVFALAVSEKAESSVGNSYEFNVDTEGYLELNVRSNNDHNHTRVTRSYLLTGDKPEHVDLALWQAARDELAKAYEKAAHPKIAVIVNREANSDQRLYEDINKKGNTDDGISNGNVRNNNTDSKNGKNERDLEVQLNTIEMENAIFKRLGNLGLKTKDIDVARQIIRKEQDFQKKVFQQKELAIMLGHKSKADIVIAGVGRVVKGGAGESQIRYTFRAIRTQSGDVLGTSSMSAIAVTWNKNVGDAIDEVSAKVVGDLVDQMINRWSPPSEITIELLNTSNIRDLNAVARLLQDKVADVKYVTVEGISTGYQDGGVGTLTVVYDSSFEDLLTALNRNDLPFHLANINSNRKILRMKITGKLD